MKKIIQKATILLLSAMILFGAKNQEVQAQESQMELKTYGSYRYRYDQATDSIHIVKYTGEEEVVVIPSEIEGKPVTKIEGFGEYIYEYYNIASPKTKEVYIPEGVVEIGPDAFQYCVGLEKVELPEGLNIIEEYAFCECTSLKEIVIPDSVTKVGKDAFAGCTKLLKVKLSNNLTAIEEGSFSYCNIRSIQIPDKVTRIEKSAFRSNRLKEVKIPSRVTRIGISAFESNRLKEVTIPSNVTHIGRDAFYGNLSLKEVTISSSVKQIGYRAFANCKTLKKIKIKGTKLKTIKKDAFKNIHSKAVFDVPNKLKKEYKQRLIKSQSFKSKTQKIK